VDREPTAVEPGGARASNARRVLAFVCVTAFAVVLNGTMLPVALPEIGRSMSLDTAQVGWLTTGYFLMNGVAIPFFGRLADLRGVDRLYAAGLLTFFLGSVACGLAPGYEVLMAGRLVQGVGAAAVVGLGPTAVSLSYPPGERGVAIGFVGAAVGVGAAAGPVLGGFVAQAVGWRYLFLAGVLFGALAPLALKALPRGEPRVGGGFDRIGALLLAVSLGGLLLALTEGAKGGVGAPSFVVPALVGAGALFGLILRQRTAEDPFLPRALLGNRRYVWLCAITALFIGINITAEVAVPLLLAEVNRLSAGVIGLVLLPPALATVVLGPVAGRLVDRAGIEGPMGIGALAVVLALVLISAFGVGGGVVLVSVLVSVVSVGATLAKIAATTGVSLAVPKGNLPSGISFNEMVWILGTSLGTALLTATLTARSEAPRAFNPLHTGGGANYSDVFLVLSVPILLVLCALPALSRAGR
jgi:EmrB/QacA subfamily drug resistance transporter